MEPSAQQTIEILKAAKPLFDNGGGALTAAVGALGAVGGALAAYLPTRLMARHHRETLRKSTAFQLYAELQSLREIEKQRGYIAVLRATVDAFNRGQIKEWTLEIQFHDDRFPIYKANIGNLGTLPPKLQSRIVFFYQILEAVVQDAKPGGLLNKTPNGAAPFVENLRIAEKAKTLCDEAIAEIEHLYPDVK